MQVARSSNAIVRCALAAALALIVGAPAAAPAQEQTQEQMQVAQAATAKAKPKTKAKGKTKAKKAATSKSKAKTKSEAKAVQAKASPAEGPADQDSSGDQPTPMAAGKLPKPIGVLHTCAASDTNVEVSWERFEKAVVFLVSCPPARSGLAPVAVYLANDHKGTAARRVTFELPGADGQPAQHDTVFSAIPAREAYTNPGDLVPDGHVRNDPPWISGAWRPDDRPGVCSVTGHWRIQGDKAELWFWEEATACPKDASPNYEVKLDRKPPPLVMR